MVDEQINGIVEHDIDLEDFARKRVPCSLNTSILPMYSAPPVSMQVSMVAGSIRHLLASFPRNRKNGKFYG